MLCTFMLFHSEMESAVKTYGGTKQGYKVFIVFNVATSLHFVLRNNCEVKSQNMNVLFPVR